MVSTYFPHSTGGSKNPERSNTITYNLIPNCAISLDPRNIISEWSTNALKTLSQTEVFVGQEIYCLADNITRICRWIPSAGNFTGANCLWDKSYQEAKTEWIDITSDEYVPEKSLDEKVQEQEKLAWRFQITSSFGYWGFYNFDSDEPNVISQWLETNYNEVIKDIIPNIANDDVLAKSITARQIKTGMVSISINSTEPGTQTYKSAKAFADAADRLLFVMIPSAESVGIKKITLNSVIQDENLYMTKKSLECINTTTFDFDNVQYLFYVFTQKRFTDTSLTMEITFG